MASDHHFLISGNAPFSQDGIFEVELAISESKPSDTEIKTKSFSSIWKQNFHLKVKNGRFQETIGSHENPLPDSISSFSKIWIVVTDQFSSLGGSFEFDIPESAKSTTEKIEKTPEDKIPREKKSLKKLLIIVSAALIVGIIVYSLS